MSALIGRPTVKPTTAFDKYKLNQNPYIINFTWNGQKCNGNRLTIIETGQSHDVTGLSLTYHTLNYSVCNQLKLNNDNTYHATITMLDYAGNPISNPSEQFLLYCYATPAFEINELKNLKTINTTSFTAMLNYYDSSQQMGLSSYQFNLYDSNKSVVLDHSDELYILPDSTTTDYSTCSHTFSGLENGKSYYIEAVGITIYGMELQCSYYVTVKVNSSSVYNLIIGNNSRDGNIKFNISCIPMGYDHSDNLSYVNNEEIDLRKNNSYIKYTLVKPLKDFKFKIKLRAIKDLTKAIISFSDSNGTDKTIVSIVPEIQYVHKVILADDTVTNELIRPQKFIYNDNSINKQYIDYIKSAKISLNLYADDKLYTVNGTCIDLLYDSNKDMFCLDEHKNIIIKVTKHNGNYDLEVTEIQEV